MRKPCYHYKDGYCYSEDVIEGRAECPYAQRHPDGPELVLCTEPIDEDFYGDPELELWAEQEEWGECYDE